MTDLTGEVLAWLEESQRRSDKKMAQAAGLAPEIVAEVEAAAELPPLVKKIVMKFFPQEAAKEMNKAGLSAEDSGKQFLLGAAALYAYDRFATRRALAATIEASQKKS